MAKRAKHPLSLEDTVAKLKAAESEIAAHTLPRIILDVRRGKADQDQVRSLFRAFCVGVSDPRARFPDPIISEIVGFIAERFAVFLTGREPDLSRALGITHRGKGRRARSSTRWRDVFRAAKVREHMDAGMPLDEAAERVAESEGIHESTARDCYTKYQRDARLVLIYRHLFT